METVAWGPNWSMQETTDLTATWGDAEAQQQFGQANAHIYTAIVESLQKRSRQCPSQQCRIKVKALWVQWIHIRDHNHWSRDAHRSMHFMRQLDRILSLRHPGEACHVFSSMGRLPEPAPQPSNEEDSVEEGPVGHQPQVLSCSPPLAS
ncbi:hypothetical protein Y1Q_0022868 [Alligator mississippiensis]|uniref:Uncharacterized protein n=1 Tax=Alligator mississippiensis TaxID=8496 RepID=A0A151N4Q1_ALLMI|nr:hypothetical protein Y1Q_0022868 [Alligator mississippiensis]